MKLININYFVINSGYLFIVSYLIMPSRLFFFYFNPFSLPKQEISLHSFEETLFYGFKRSLNISTRQSVLIFLAFSAKVQISVNAFFFRETTAR